MAVQSHRALSTVRRSLYAAIIFLVAVGLLLQLCTVAVVTGNSMLPTYRSGEYLVVSRLGARLRKPREGDVVLIRHGAEVLIKRVAYVAGSSIPRDETSLYRNVRDFFDRPTGGRPDGLVVPPDALVVLGDNRPESDDSRTFGPVDMRDVLGFVVGARPAP